MKQLKMPTICRERERPGWGWCRQLEAGGKEREHHPPCSQGRRSGQQDQDRDGSAKAHQFLPQIPAFLARLFRILFLPLTAPPWSLRDLPTSLQKPPFKMLVFNEYGISLESEVLVDLLYLILCDSMNYSPSDCMLL